MGRCGRSRLEEVPLELTSAGGVLLVVENVVDEIKEEADGGGLDGNGEAVAPVSSATR